ncbi:MAG: hypothetical protein R3F62_14185 [Planctomycetota bacterium]
MSVNEPMQPQEESKKEVVLRGLGFALAGMGIYAAPAVVEMALAVDKANKARVQEALASEVSTATKAELGQLRDLISGLENRAELSERRQATFLKLFLEAGTHPEPDFQRAKARLVARLGLGRVGESEALEASMLMDRMVRDDLLCLQIVDGLESEGVGVWPEKGSGPNTSRQPLDNVRGSHEDSLIDLARQRAGRTEDYWDERITRAIQLGTLKTPRRRSIGQEHYRVLATTAIGRLIADQFRCEAKPGLND